MLLEETDEERAARFVKMAYGPIGKAVKDAMPHTEADPVGVLAAVLALYSSSLNGHVFQPSERPSVVWTALAGRSKLGRKGYALSTAEAILSPSIGKFLKSHRRQGISSGPALVTTLFEAEQDSLASETGLDGRVVVVDEEWSTTLKRTTRCPTYSGVFRTAWDGKRVVNTTKGKDGRREEQAVNVPQLGFHAHIQPRAWAKYISQDEALGGSYNRILPVYVRKSKLLPYGNESPLSNVQPSRALALAYEWARKEQRHMRLSEPARELYNQLREDYDSRMAAMPESLSCFIERSDEQVMRVASILTAASRKLVISREALEAARHFVEFSIESVRELVTGQADEIARPAVKSLEDRIREGLTTKGEMRSSDLNRYLGSRFTAAQINAAVAEMPDVEVEKLKSDRPGTKPTVYRIVVAEPDEGPVETSEEMEPVRPTLTVVEEPKPKAPRQRAPRKTPTKKTPAQNVSKKPEEPESSFAHLL
ncbi:DUF3987 domain-containing protein [Streptomyces sp. NPDC055036]